MLVPGLQTLQSSFAQEPPVLVVNVRHLHSTNTDNSHDNDGYDDIYTFDTLVIQIIATKLSRIKNYGSEKTAK